jgi:hypothetical protein
LCGQGGQLLFGLVGAPLKMRGLCCHEAGLEAGAGLDSGPGQAFGDDGVGGADPSQGTGLAGLADRIEALGGRLEIASPPRSGTSLSIEIPVEGPNATTFLGP